MEKIIKIIKFDREMLNGLNEEFEDLIDYLHNDNSENRLEKLKQKFSNPIAKSMPLFCGIFSLNFEYDDRGNEYSEIKLIFKNK